MTVTVPDRTLSITHFFATHDQPRTELYNLRTFGSSTLLYRRPNSDADSGWLLTDVDHGAGSTVGLDFTPPAAPQGLMSIPVSGNSGNLTLYFDETLASAFAGQQFVRRYEIHIETPASRIVPANTESGSAPPATNPATTKRKLNWHAGWLTVWLC